MRYFSKCWRVLSCSTVAGLCALSQAHAAAGPGIESDVAVSPTPALQRDNGATARLPGGNSEEFRRRMQGWMESGELAELRTIEREATVRPMRLAISSPFGWRSDPIKGIRRQHDGIDLPAYLGASVYATGTGTVSIAGWVNGYGNLVEIAHLGGVRTRYGHLSRILVLRGMVVTQGQSIGAIGSTGRSTGPHLHYEVRVHGVPANPLEFIGQTVPTYETAWLPEEIATARSTGWHSPDDTNSLPRATIR